MDHNERLEDPDVESQNRNSLSRRAVIGGTIGLVGLLGAGTVSGSNGNYWSEDNGTLEPNDSNMDVAVPDGDVEIGEDLNFSGDGSHDITRDDDRRIRFLDDRTIVDIAGDADDLMIRGYYGNTLARFQKYPELIELGKETYVDANLECTGEVDIDGETHVDADLECTGGHLIGEDLVCLGDAVIDDDLICYGEVIFDGDASVHGELILEGDEDGNLGTFVGYDTYYWQRDSPWGNRIGHSLNEGLRWENFRDNRDYVFCVNGDESEDFGETGEKALQIKGNGIVESAHSVLRLDLGPSSQQIPCDGDWTEVEMSKAEGNFGDIVGNVWHVSEDGYYYITFSAAWNSSSDWSTGDRVRAHIQKNGSTLTGSRVDSIKVSTEQQKFPRIDWSGKLSKNDELSFELWQNSDDTQSISGSANRRTNASILHVT